MSQLQAYGGPLALLLLAMLVSAGRLFLPRWLEAHAQKGVKRALVEHQHSLNLQLEVQRSTLASDAARLQGDLAKGVRDDAIYVEQRHRAVHECYRSYRRALKVLRTFPPEIFALGDEERRDYRRKQAQRAWQLAENAYHKAALYLPSPVDEAARVVLQAFDECDTAHAWPGGTPDGEYFDPVVANAKLDSALVTLTAVSQTELQRSRPPEGL